MARFCTSCGAEAAPEDRFCAACGAALRTTRTGLDTDGRPGTEADQTGSGPADHELTGGGPLAEATDAPDGQHRDFFLCHATEDKAEYVIPLAHELKKRGLSVWLDRAEIMWGDRIDERINKGLTGSRFVIAFLSDNFLRKQWPKDELYAAMNMEGRDGGKKVLPLALTDIGGIVADYPLLSRKLIIPFSEGISAIADQCQKLAQGGVRIVSNTHFEVEDREDMVRAGYRKNENIEYSFVAPVRNGTVHAETGLPPGKVVLVEIANRELEGLAAEFGSRAAVLDVLAEVMPDKAEGIEENAEAMAALTNFAKLFAKPSLRKQRKRQRLVVGEGGVIEVSELGGFIDGWEAELKVTLIS